MTAKEYIHVYKDGLKMLNVAHEDVAYCMFPNTLANVSTIWYVNLVEGSITSWAQLDKAFVNQFKLPIDPIILYYELAMIYNELAIS